MKLNEYQNTIYVKLQRAKLPAAVTNKISHVAERLAGDFMKEEKFLVLNWFPKFFLQTKERRICAQCAGLEGTSFYTFLLLKIWKTVGSFFSIPLWKTWKTEGSFPTSSLFFLFL